MLSNIYIFQTLLSISRAHNRTLNLTDGVLKYPPIVDQSQAIISSHSYLRVCVYIYRVQLQVSMVLFLYIINLLVNSCGTACIRTNVYKYLSIIDANLLITYKGNIYFEMLKHFLCVYLVSVIVILYKNIKIQLNLSAMHKNTKTKYLLSISFM